MRTLALFLLAAVVLPTTLPAQIELPIKKEYRPGSEYREPFKIIANLYYVGAREMTSFLLTSDQGHILIDGGYDEMAADVAKNIEKLGFQLKDVKVIVNSHAHLDHAGALAELKRRTGAQLVASAADAELMARGGIRDFHFLNTLPYPKVRADRTVADGETVTVGPNTLTAVLTPGHTKGCVTWTTVVKDKGRDLRVVFIGSMSVPGYNLVSNLSYSNIAQDYESSFQKLQALACDIPLGSHGTFFRLIDKRDALNQGDPDAFIDPEGYRAYLRAAEKNFRLQLARQNTSQ